MTAASKYAPVPGKIPGTAMNLGGRKLVLAPLSLTQIKQFAASVESMGKKDTLEENFEEAFPVVLASLNRNYPEITLDDVRGLVDLGNLSTALAAIMNGGGTDVPTAEAAP